MIDLTKLTPAPWTCELRYQRSEEETHYVVQDQKGNVLFDTVNSEVTEIETDFTESMGKPYHVYRDIQGRADLEFAALARNAFDVMLRRGWGVVRFEDGRWAIVNDQNGAADALCTRVSLANDPFTALVEADAWYTKNIEDKP